MVFGHFTLICFILVIISVFFICFIIFHHACSTFCNLPSFFAQSQGLTTQTLSRCQLEASHGSWIFPLPVSTSCVSQRLSIRRLPTTQLDISYTKFKTTGPQVQNDCNGANGRNWLLSPGLQWRHLSGSQQLENPQPSVTEWNWTSWSVLIYCISFKECETLYRNLNYTYHVLLTDYPWRQMALLQLVATPSPIITCQVGVEWSNLQSAGIWKKFQTPGL